MNLLLLSILLCAVVGAAIDTGSICAVRAARDLSVGRPGLAIGSMVSVAGAAIVVYLDSRLHWQLRVSPWSYPTLLTLVGAGIFAGGALINGACAIGTIGRLARGDIGYAATLAGGALIGLALPRVAIPSRMPDLAVTTGLTWLSILLAATVALVILTPGRLRTANLGAFAVLGLVAAIVTNVQGDWTWLSLIAQVRSGLPLRYATIACFTAVILGATATALFKHHFRLVRPDPKTMLREAAGGGLMTAGALLIPGGNDSLLVSGVPSGSPLAITGYAVMFSLLVLIMRLNPIIGRWAGRD